MQERHHNRKQYFEEQGVTTSRYVIPYIETHRPVTDTTRILEIGCGEGGNLMPFVERGCEVVGVDLKPQQIEKANRFSVELYPAGKARFLAQNIYDSTPEDLGTFDIIMLRDVIEHLPNQEQFMAHMKTFLKPKGVVFFGFPPWRMPFGGHQQICHSKFLSKVPYFHLLPRFLYRAVLKLFGEPQGIIDELMDIQSTQISIHRFERIVASNDYRFAKKTLYLINPNYEVKFGLTKREQYGFIKAIPYFKDFLTTCYYCLIEQNETTDTK